MAYNQELNRQILYGTGYSDDEQKGILAVASGTDVNYTETTPTLIKMWQQIILQLGIFGSTRKLPADIIEMSPTLWSKFMSAVDADNRPLFQNQLGTARNVMGIGDPAMADIRLPMSVGQIMGVDVTVDPQLTDTFAAGRTGAATGGTQTRVIVARRADQLLMESGDGPMTVTYEATEIKKLLTTLVVYGYVAMTIGRYPEGTRIIRGTGTVIA